MDALTLTLSCALAVTPLSSCHSHLSPHALKYASLAPWQADIAAASRRFGIPIAWIEAVIRRESGGYAILNGQPITSDKGAMGLMQIMPATYAELRPRYGLGPILTRRMTILPPVPPISASFIGLTAIPICLPRTMRVRDASTAIYRARSCFPARRNPISTSSM